MFAECDDHLLFLFQILLENIRNEMLVQINRFQDPEYHQNINYQIEREKRLKSKLEEEAKQLERQVCCKSIIIFTNS